MSLAIKAAAATQHLFVSQLLTSPFVSPIPNSFTHIFYSQFYSHLYSHFLLLFQCYSHLNFPHARLFTSYFPHSKLFHSHSNFFTPIPIFYSHFIFLLPFQCYSHLNFPSVSIFVSFELFHSLHNWCCNTCQYTAIYVSMASCCFVSTFFGWSRLSYFCRSAGGVIFILCYSTFVLCSILTVDKL